MTDLRRFSVTQILDWYTSGNTSNLAGSRLFTRSRLNKLAFFTSFFGNAKRKKQVKKDKGKFIFSIILVSCYFSVFSQNFNPTFTQSSLPEVLKEIEKTTTLAFNYDPEKLAEYSFSGKLNLSRPNLFLRELLYQTPFTFELTDSAILLFLEEPKTYRICGYLKEGDTKESLPFANVFSENQVNGAQSNDAGFFDFSFTTYKNQLITISYIGYESQTFMAQEFNQNTCLDIFLKLDEDLLGSEIIVTDYLLTGIDEGEEYGSVNINFNQLSNTHTNIEQDILKTVQLIPGITSIDESATNIQIRGGTSDQNLILWEGATLYDPGHFFGMISAVNPFVVEEVKVFKGVFDPIYDNRVGGIIDMSLTDSVAQKFHGGIGTTFSEAHAFLEIPIVKNRLSILASGRNTLNKLWQTPTLSKYSVKVFQESKVSEIEESETTQVLDFYDWNAKILFRPIDQILIKGGFFESSNQYNFDIPFFDDDFNSIDKVDFRSKAMNLSSEIEFSKKWKTNLSYTQSEYRNDYQFSLIENETEGVIEFNHVFNDIKDQTFSLSNQLKLDPNLSFGFGYDYNKKLVSFNIEYESEFEENFNDFNFAKGHFHNLFTSFQFQKEQFQLNGGLRLTYYKETEDLNYSPRINSQFALNKVLKFKFSAGILQQYISQLREFGDNELGIDNPVWVLNESESEDFQEAKKISGGLVFRKDGWLLDMEGYFNKTEGLNTINPLFGKGVEVPDFAFGSSTAKGVDFLIKKRWGGFHSWMNYALSKVEFNFPEITENSFPASNDLRHNLSFINSFNWKEWNFSVSYQYRTGLRLSEPVEVMVEIDNDTGDTYYEILYEDLNAQKLNNYSRLDVGISYKKVFDSGMKTEFAFSLINLLNRENIFSRNYGLGDFNEDDVPELFSTDKFMLKRTPQVLIRFWW